MVENSEHEQEISYPQRRHSTTVEGIANTLELVVVALILAFVFRSFVAEAFRIPTGSMAETLRGSHYHLRCIRCGYGYDMGGDSFTFPSPRCPSCGYILPKGRGVPISNGDRILVLKCVYQFFEPNRWDVIVFKNPGDPRENYIKRLLASPGETIEIIDGDVFIDGVIAKKPPKVQQELWMPIFDNDFQVHGERTVESEGQGDNVAWKQPFENEEGSSWDLNAKGPTVFGVDSDPGEVQTLVFNSNEGDAFRAAYAYNDGKDRYLRPFCSDLMMQFDVTPGNSEGQIGIGLTKYGVRYEGSVDFSGEMRLVRVIDGVVEGLNLKIIDPVEIGRHRSVRFAIVDRQLVLEFGAEELRYDLGKEPYALGNKEVRGKPEVRVLGAGKMKLWHLQLYRDIHYIGERVNRGGEGKSFTLGADEFFACGDNSPASYDSRLWSGEGIGNGDIRFTKGVVPREYMMGKAFYVYWSDAFKPMDRLLPIIPNFGGVKCIYGGVSGDY